MFSLELWQEALCSTRVANGVIKEHLALPQGSQASFEVARVTLGFLLSC